MRRYEILALDAAGKLVDDLRAAPAHPLFESAFSALARGTLVATEAGPMAVEDLVPGIRVETRDDGLQPLLWRGATSLMPKPGEAGSRACLYRIPMDAFGPQRPMPDLVLGPHARLVHRAPALEDLVGQTDALVPLAVFEDGQSVVRVTPATPVRVFHLGFAKHQIITVNGLEIETVHPGSEFAGRQPDGVVKMFLSLFPHISAMHEFGPPAMPRLSMKAAEAMRAA